MASPTTAPEIGMLSEIDGPVTRRGALYLNPASPSWILALTFVALFVGFGWLTLAFFSVQFSIYPLLRDALVTGVNGLTQLNALSVGRLDLAVVRFAALAALVSGFAFERFDWPLVPWVLAGLATPRTAPRCRRRSGSISRDPRRHSNV